jgi:hypothetical protein
MLLGVAAGAWWGLFSLFLICTDSWVAPIHLSPDNDKVLQIKLNLNGHLAELARYQAEVGRLDAEIAGVDAGIKQLSAIRNSSKASLMWEADLSTGEARHLEQSIKNLRTQRGLLTDLHHRQKKLTETARLNLKQGLVGRTSLEGQEQALDRLALRLVENAGQLEDARQMLREKQIASRAFRAGLGEAGESRSPRNGQMPEVAASQEHGIRLALELIRLEAEARSLRAIRHVAAENISQEEQLLEQIRSRPIYRAMHAKTNVAFVPYDQLEGVGGGGKVLACIWGLFGCREVGTVAEVLPGEVITEDPWGDLARGQYAILELNVPEAIREEVLRIRKN